MLLENTELLMSTQQTVFQAANDYGMSVKQRMTAAMHRVSQPDSSAETSVHIQMSGCS